MKKKWRHFSVSDARERSVRIVMINHWQFEHEDLSGLKRPVNQLREAILPLIIEAVAQKDLDADPAAWPRI